MFVLLFLFVEESSLSTFCCKLKGSMDVILVLLLDQSLNCSMDVIWCVLCAFVDNDLISLES